MKKSLLAKVFVELFLNEEAFTPAFFADFSAHFFEMDCIDDVVTHLVQLWARGMVDNSTHFIEGFGDPADYGIRFNPSSVIDCSVHVVTE